MSLPVWKNKWDTLCHKASPPLNPLTEDLRLAGSLADECCTEELAAWAIRSLWSARSSTDGGIVRPSAFAVLRLITNSNLVGCSTGRVGGRSALEDLIPNAPARSSGPRI